MAPDAPCDTASSRRILPEPKPPALLPTSYSSRLGADPCRSPPLPTYLPTWMQTHRRWATLAFLTGQLRDRARTRVEARAGTFARYVPPRCFPAIQ